MIYSKLLPLLVYAEGGDIVGTFQKFANDFYGKAQLIVIPIAVIIFIACGVMYMLASSSQATQNAKSWAFRCFVGFLIVESAPAILATIQGFASNGGTLFP